MEVNLMQTLQALTQQSGSSATPVLDQSGDKFAALMQQGQLTPPVDGPDSQSLVTKLVTDQDNALQQVPADITFLMEHQGTMSANQFTAAALQVSSETAMLQVNMEVKMAVVKSSKDAVETLMKNQ
jgi:type III secretion inner rod protein HrpB2